MADSIRECYFQNTPSRSGRAVVTISFRGKAPERGLEFRMWIEQDNAGSPEPRPEQTNNFTLKGRAVGVEDDDEKVFVDVGPFQPRVLPPDGVRLRLRFKVILRDDSGEEGYADSNWYYPAR